MSKSAKPASAKTTDAANRQLLVLGMHRSGTSAVTGALARMGVHVGDEAQLTPTNWENPLGFFERREARRICDALLHASGADWWKVSAFDPDNADPKEVRDQRKPIAELVASLDAHGHWALKEPRLCLLAPIFKGALVRPLAVIVMRHPLEIARSLRHRNGFPLRAGLALWEAYMASALRHGLAMEHVFADYDAIVRDPQAALGRLAAELEALGVDGLDADAARQAISADLRRERVDEAEARRLLTRAQSALWRALQQPGGPDGPPALSEEAIATLREFEADEGLRQRMEADARRLSAERARLETERNALKVERDALLPRAKAGDEAEALKQRLSKADETLAQARAEARRHLDALRLKEGAIEALQARLSEQDARLNAAASERGRLAAEHEAQRKRADAAEKALAEHRRRREQAEAELQRAAGERDAQARRAEEAEARAEAAARAADAVRSTMSWRVTAPLRAVRRNPVSAWRTRRRMNRLKAEIGDHFDAAWYASQYPDVAAGDHLPFHHFMEFGWREGRRPNPVFDPAWYLARNPDVAKAGINPLLHFARSGAAEGRDPSPEFSMRFYLERHADVAAAGLDPVTHYLRSGRREGREIRASGALEGPAAADPEPGRPPEPLRSVAPSPKPEPLPPAAALAPERAAAILARIAAAPPVCVVIPVYNAPEETDRCLASVRRCTPEGVRILVLDDASPDARVGAVLERHGADPRVEVRRNRENLGFTRNVNQGMSLAGDADVVLLNADTEVGPLWLQNLRIAAYSGDRVGTATPFSDNAGAFSAPEIGQANPLPPGVDTDAAARAVAQASLRLYPETPTGNGYCLYIRRDCLTQTGPFDAEAFPRGYGEENDFCMRARARGWTHVVDDAGYVRHVRSASFGEEKAALLKQGRAVLDARHPDYTAAVRAFTGGEPLRRAREQVRKALEQARAGAAASSATRRARKLDLRVCVLGWDVGHNPLGRSYMVAEICQRLAKSVVMTGWLHPRYGKAVWPPLAHSELPVVALPGHNFPEYWKQLERFTREFRPDVVIACKPRLPALQAALRLREKAGCPLVLDIDDHELSFFKNRDQFTLSDLEALDAGTLSEAVEPYEEVWTRLAESLVGEADAILTSNRALRDRFGGVLVPHARDETRFDPERFPDRASLRRSYGVPAHAKVALFFGTPRAHKGLEPLAKAVGELEDEAVRLVIAGGTPDAALRRSLDMLAGERIIYLPAQPFQKAPEILALADAVLLPQDIQHPISQYQLPAKAIDAIAMGVPLLTSDTPPLRDLIEAGLARRLDPEAVTANLAEAFASGRDISNSRSVRDGFLNGYSYEALSNTMRAVLEEAVDRGPGGQFALSDRLEAAQRRALGLPKQAAPAASGADIVVFWKQNDTTLYGRRHDMVIRYLASRPDVRKVVVFDAPMNFQQLDAEAAGEPLTQGRLVYERTWAKHLGGLDDEKIRYRVWLRKAGTAAPDEADASDPRPRFSVLFGDYVERVLAEEGIRADQAVFWLYPRLPGIEALLDRFKPAKTVVDVVDDHRAWPGIADEDRDRLTRHYDALLRRADVAFANCEPVRRSMSEYKPDIVLVPNGCDPSPPVREPSAPEFAKLCAWEGPVAGFIGNLEAKIDIELLDALARRRPDVLVVLVGSTHANPAVRELARHQNVLMPGPAPFEEAGAWARRFHVGLIPHLRTAMTEHMNPLKLYFYASHGVPVVSTDIPNIEDQWSGVSVASDHDAFVQAVERVLSSDRPADFNAFVQAHSWPSRLERHVDSIVRSLPGVFEPDEYEGACALCGERQVFQRMARAIRETYSCMRCGASLRERAQAEALLGAVAPQGVETLDALVKTNDFRHLRIYEPGTTGAFRKFFQGLSGYTQSVYTSGEDSSPEFERYRQENLEALSFEDASFDIIMTSDIMEHVRRPDLAFKEQHRVLSRTGILIFTIPFQKPYREFTLKRVETSGDVDIYIQPKIYHGDGRGGRSLVYNDFGLDLIESLETIGFDVSIVNPQHASDLASRVATFVCVKRA